MSTERRAMTRQAFYVKWGIPASVEMRDDLIAALAVEAPGGDLPAERPEAPTSAGA